MITRLAFSVATVVAALGPSTTEGSKILNVRFVGGEFARVQVLELDDDRVKLRVLADESSMQVERKLADFDPHSAFRIELQARDPDSFEDHFSMARRAADLDLETAATEHAIHALGRLPDTPEAETRRKRLAFWATANLERWLERTIDAGDIEQSIRHLEVLSTRFSDHFPEERLDQLATRVLDLEQDRAAQRRAARQSRLDAQARRSIERRLAPIRRAVTRGDEFLRKAIASSRRVAESNRLATRAIKAYESAWRAAEKLQAKHPKNRPLCREIESIANHVHQHEIQAALHAASVLTVRGDFVAAMDRVHDVLALDPTHDEAREMRRAIAIAGAAASAGFGLGQGPVVVPQSLTR